MSLESTQPDLPPMRDMREAARAQTRRLTAGLVYVFAVGLAVIAGLMAYISKRSFLPFVIYRVLLGGVPGVAPAKVVILGGGVVGTNAAAMALGLGADVVVLERSTERMEELVARFGTQLKTLYSTQGAIEDECVGADLVIGGVLIPGAAAPKLVTRRMLKDYVAMAYAQAMRSPLAGAAGTMRTTGTR